MQRGYFYPGRNTIIFSACIALTVFTTGCLTACREQATAITMLPDRTRVIVQSAQSVTVKDTILLSGELEAEKTASLSFLVPGKVDMINALEGDYVEQGQVLSTVESSDYQSNLEITEAIFEKARNEYDMYQPIFQEGAFAEKDFINIKMNLATSKASRDIARKKRRDTQLKAPFPGTISIKNIELGQMVSPESPAFTIVKTDLLFARLAVPESEIGKISRGQAAEITIPALDDLVVVGEVTSIGPSADLRTRTYPVKITLSNSENILRTGMIVQAKITTGNSLTAFTVPGNSIVRDVNNLTYVFIVDSTETKAMQQRVETGSVYGQGVEIRSGLQPEDLVITGGQQKLTDGSKIVVDDHRQKDKG